MAYDMNNVLQDETKALLLANQVEDGAFVVGWLPLFVFVVSE